MNNMRRGFTMIELVFVIVIIGILAAVALPRFTGIADDAHTSKLEAFTGTLNKTVGPSIWSSIQRKYPAANGEVNATGVPLKYANLFDAASAPTGTTASDAQLESVPSEFGYAVGSAVIDISNCDITANGATDTQIIGGTAVASATIGTSTYELVCSPGSLAAAPHFYLLDATATPKLIVTR